MSEILPKQPDIPLEGPLVVVLVYDGLCTFEFAIAAEIFGLARPEMGSGWYRFSPCRVEAGALRAHGGLRIELDTGPELIDAADLVVIPGWKGADAPVPPELLDALRRAHDRGARLASICSGAFLLAATGLLDGRRAATHWRHAHVLQEAYPAVQVDSSVLYVEEDGLFTSAGSAAGLDLLLHIIRADFGARAANSVARRLVIPPHRSGGQAQFVERPIARIPNSRLAPLMDSMLAEPAREWRIRDMAREAAMSERTFMRRFTEATGMTPAQWLARARVQEARSLLETTGLSIEAIAQLTGFGTPANLRHHFTAETQLSPRQYRNRFGRGPKAPGRTA